MQQTEFKATWMKALRSGDFLQATSALFGDAEYDHKGDAVERYEDEDGDRVDPKPGHCCLGVAIEITGGDPDPANQCDEIPSAAWQAKWGVTHAQCEALAGLNDGGSSFDYIADVIEFGEFTPFELEDDDD